MAKPGRKGLLRIVYATQYSWQGLKAAWKNEAAFRQELLLALIGIPIAVWLAENTYELLWLILPLFLLVMAELVNSAIEAVVDRISDEHHELAGRAKDIGSAIVFVALILLLVIWSLILFN
ncbi:MAG: diacylglycerol kinase [Kangiellaceae bacterium]|jgi:diacylglycerol kinase (ATP)